MKRFDHFEVRFPYLIRDYSDLHTVDKHGKFMVHSEPYLSVEIIQSSLFTFTVVATRQTDSRNTSFRLLNCYEFVVADTWSPRLNWQLRTRGHRR